MPVTRIFSRRLSLLLTAIVGWIALGSSAFSFSVGHPTAGLLKALVVIVLMALVIDGRLYRSLESRPISALSVIVLVLGVALLVAFEASQLRFAVAAFQGLRTVPGIVRVARAIGSFLLGAVLAVEGIRTLRHVQRS
jgi:hypothetical protein